MKLNELTAYLESFAPLAYQEDYDNSGLIVGNPAMEISSALLSLDCTEEVVDEAIRKGCNVVISHHPIVFKGLKKFTGRTYVERVIMKAIRHDIAIYAIHTNLDHVTGGVNSKICERLGLENCRPLLSRDNLLRKLVTFVPSEHAENIRKALFSAGAGTIGGYDECSFNAEGTGTFRAGEDTNPYVGSRGTRHEEKEIRVEVILPAVLQAVVEQALRKAHPYEEPAYDIFVLENTYSQVGAGMIGELREERGELEFLNDVKKQLRADVIRHTATTGKPVKKVAVCGGAGGFLLSAAIKEGADVFVTADYKYHDFFDADGKLVIADVGHFESEQFTSELLFDIIRKKFPTFAVLLTEINTNPIKYLI
jgi:dinuclear metal center YbgI/SA1388 family protein